MARSTRPPPTASQALVDEIRRLRERGLSVREIGRRTGLSKSFVHNVSVGKRGVSTIRAATAAARLPLQQPALTIIEGGGIRAIDPVGRRERQKLGRDWRAVQDGREKGDLRGIKRRFRSTIIKTSEGEFRLETDPDVLQDLDDACLLAIEEVFHYEPTANAA
jgi:hypothetical protein